MRANFVLSGVWEGVRRNLSMTTALILNAAILLTFVGGTLLGTKLTDKFKDNYVGKLNVSVFACAATSDGPTCNPGRKSTQAELDTLQKELRASPEVESASFVSEQEQYEKARATQSERVRKFLTVGALPASFTVKLKDIDKNFDAFKTKFEATDGVSGVANSISAIRTVLDVMTGFRNVMIVAGLFVLIASILLIANTIQVAASQRKNETSIMRLVGASRWMTELPFMLEALVATVVGAIISFGILAVGKFVLLNKIFKVQVENGVIPGLDMNDVLIASGVSLIGGVLLAAFTAFATLRLYVKL